MQPPISTEFRSFERILGIFSRVTAATKLFTPGFCMLCVAMGAGGAPDATVGVAGALEALHKVRQGWYSAHFHLSTAEIIIELKT